MLMASALAVALVVGCSSTQMSAPAPDTTPAASAAPAPDTAPAVSAPPAANTAPTTTRARRTLPAETVPPTSLPADAAGTVPPVVAEPVEAPAAVGHGLGSIEIPKLGLTRFLFEGIELTTLDEGPGHWPGTAMPGEAGNVVVAGHRISHNADFGDLHQLNPDDEVIFNTEGGRHVYSVVSTEIVQPDALWIVDQTPEPTATLFACHPPGSVSQRIVVHLQLAG